jgi:hypothetical protein
MRQEEAELRLKKYHSKIFGKQSNVVNDTIFDIFQRLSQQKKSSTSMKLLDVLQMHLNLNKTQQFGK